MAFFGINAGHCYNVAKLSGFWYNNQVNINVHVH